MKITISTDKETASYDIDYENVDPTNDEVCRAIAFIDIVREKLLEGLKMDLEVYTTKY